MLPREKALVYGIGVLSDEELLALVLKSGYRGNTVYEIVRRLLEKSQGFKNLLSMSYEEFISVDGINRAKALEMLAILEIAKRLSSIDKVSEEELDCPSKIIDYLKFTIGFSEQEEFLVIFLNSSGTIIKSEIIFKGSKNTSVVGIDEVMRRAINYKAGAIIACHNHPSGRVKPSEADIRVTRNLVKFGEMLKIPLLDHIIISKEGFYSFKQNNLL